MKNILLRHRKFIAALLLISAVLFAAYVPVNQIEYKPTRPRLVRHVIFTSLEAANEYIDDCVHGGFIIKSVSYANPSIYSGSERVLVIAEKY